MERRGLLFSECLLSTYLCMPVCFVFTRMCAFTREYLEGTEAEIFCCVILMTH